MPPALAGIARRCDGRTRRHDGPLRPFSLTVECHYPWTSGAQTLRARPRTWFAQFACVQSAVGDSAGRGGACYVGVCFAERPVSARQTIPRFRRLSILRHDYSLRFLPSCMWHRRDAAGFATRRAPHAPRADALANTVRFGPCAMGADRNASWENATIGIYRIDEIFTNGGRARDYNPCPSRNAFATRADICALLKISGISSPRSVFGMRR